LTEYRGVVTLGDDDVDVTVELAFGRVRLRAGDQEIGDWPEAECRFAREDGTDTWRIEAEADSLPFRPLEPDSFATAVAPPIEPEPEPVADPVSENGHAAQDRPGRHRDPDAPKATTVIGFYMLATTTAVFGIWALLNLIN
jgi:hypothetical protein